MLLSLNASKILLLLLTIHQSVAKKPLPKLPPGRHWDRRHCHALLRNDPCFNTPGTLKYCVSEQYREPGKAPEWLNLKSLASTEPQHGIDLSDLLLSSVGGPPGAELRSELDLFHLSDTLVEEGIEFHNKTSRNRLSRRSNDHDCPCCQVTMPCFSHLKMMKETHIGGTISEKDGDDYWRMCYCLGAWEASCGIRHLDNWPHFNPPPLCSNP